MTTVEIHGDSVLLRSADPDATLRALFLARDEVQDIEVTGAGLEEAFLTLTHSLFGSQPAEGLKQSVELMVSMAAYGAIGAVLFATGPRVAAERGTGWLRQLRTTPLSAGKVIAARVLAAMTLGFPAVVLVSITAALAHGVRLTAGEWAAFIALTTLGTAPFAMLGLMIGYLADGDSSYSLTLAVWFVLPAIGGLWMPLSILPKVLRTIGHVLPTNRLGDLGPGWTASGRPGSSAPICPRARP